MHEPSSFLLLDAARLEDEMENAKQQNPHFDSLYRGRSEENLASVAPYLFEVTKGENFEKWYFEKGWGDSWGILAYSPESMKHLHKHFRKFLMVKTEEGEELYFRFYDPRVLRIFLPTCNQDQLKEFFGPVSYYICEDEDPAYGIMYSLENSALKTNRLTKEEIIAFNPVLKSSRFSFF
jgi:hypothetical protein